MSRSKAGRWRRWLPSWRLPLLFGSGHCFLQVVLAGARFGGDDWPSRWLRPELLLFFVPGFIAGWSSEILLRGAAGSQRTLLIVCIAVAAAFAVPTSVLGGLFGPSFVVVGALLPFLLFVGLPVLARSLWLRLARAARA